MVVPLQWKSVRLGDVATILRGGSPRPIQHYLTTDPSGINWIKIGDVKPGAKYIEQTRERITEDGRQKSRDVHAGDLLLSNSMSYGMPYILCLDGCIHDGWLVIQGYEGTFNQDFLFYALSSDEITEQYRRMSAGSSVQNLNKDKVESVLICTPSRKEQNAIAEALDEIDNLISALERLIEKKRELARGTQLSLLTGQVRFPGFHDAWETAYLRECFTTKSGNTLAREDLNYHNGPMKDIHYGDILTAYPAIIDAAASIVPFITSDSAAAGEKLADGDVVVADTAEDFMVGKACEITGTEKVNVVAGLHTIALHPVDNRFALGYAGYYLNASSFHDSLLPFAHGTKVISISKSDLMGLTIQYPSRAEQKIIVDTLLKFDSEVREQETKLNKYKQIRQGMMRELLTGHIRLVQE